MDSHNQKQKKSTGGGYKAGERRTSPLTRLKEKAPEPSNSTTQEYICVKLYLYRAVQVGFGTL